VGIYAICKNLEKQNAECCSDFFFLLFFLREEYGIIDVSEKTGGLCLMTFLKQRGASVSSCLGGQGLTYHPRFGEEKPTKGT
jgi:hypothetical protein